MITIIPLAMGLTLTYYSPDIKQFIWYYPRFKLIMGLNLFTILLLLITMKISDEQVFNFIMDSCFISVVLVLIITSFYIFSIVKKIDPLNLMEEISKEITINKVFNNDGHPIELFITFMEDLYNNKDYILLQKSLIKFKEKMLEVTDKIENTDNIKIKDFTDKLFNRVKESYFFSLNKNDDVFFSYTIKTIIKISEDVLKKGNDKAGKEIIETFKSIADLAIRKKNEEAIDKLNYYFEKLGKISIEGNLNNTLKKILVSLKDNWIHIKREGELSDLSESIIIIMSNLGEFAVENQKIDSLNEVNFFLEKIAISSIENNYKEDFEEVISSYEKILDIAIWRSLE